ncbi:MAG: dolichyl-phosphate beta-glucosyltransferase [Bryobacteraceae bacterium]
MISSLSIVVPAYNEAVRLPATLEKIIAYLRSRRIEFHEILVVDDGSSDETAAVAERLAESHPHLRVLKNPGNRGKGYSVRHGMLQAKGEWVLFTDADLSAPIEELDRLAAAVIREKAQAAIGSRGMDSSMIGVHQPGFREAAGRFFNLVMRTLTGLPFKDTQCGFKLFDRDAVERIFSRQLLERFGFDVEVLFIARVQGIRVVEVPVRWDHVEGSKVGLLSGLNGFVDIWRVLRNHWAGRYR